MARFQPGNMDNGQVVKKNRGGKCKPTGHNYNVGVKK